MVYFQIKHPILGKFWRAFGWKMLTYLWPFGIYFQTFVFYDHLVHFMFIWYKNLASLELSMAF
jgi:hypothetical protein